MKRGIKAARLNKWGRYLFFIAVFFLFVPPVLNIWRNSSWDGVRRFTIVIQTNSANSSPLSKIAIFSLEPKEKRAIYVSLPGNTLLDVPYGYNSYQSSSIYQLGELEGSGKGGRLLSKSIESSLGIAIDGYVIAKEHTFLPLPQTEQDIKQIKSQYFSLMRGLMSLPQVLVSSRKIDTNLTAIDKWRLWRKVKDLRIDQINFLDLSHSQALQQDQLPDGTRVLLINKELFDVAFLDSFQDSSVRSDNITLEIVNATNKERLAGEFARILEHMGGNVILKTTAKNTIADTCLLYFASPKLTNAAITERLKKHYKCTKKERVNEEEILTDIKIVLGEGFIK